MIPRDKLLHLALGLIALLAAMPALWLHSIAGLGPTLACVTTVVGVGYEVQQRIRGEGQVEALDAVCTAAPGWVAWAIIEVAPGLRVLEPFVR